MRGDRLVIGEGHTAIAALLCDRILDAEPDRMVVTIAGESGAGKSELGSELTRLLVETGIATALLQQDDYFVFPPRTNHEMRRINIDQVGPYEVKLDLLDANLRAFKRGWSPIYKPIIDYDENVIDHEELDVSAIRVTVVEGTYTTALRFADLRVFIDRTYLDTLTHRRARARDRLEPFVEEVLRREHALIRAHRALADLIVARDFDRLAAADQPKGS